MKLGVIDAGGGLRGIYGTAVLDYCQDNDISFDYCIGISAGSANIASYLSKQRGRNIPFYSEYCFRKEYMSVDTLIRTGSYLDIDYIYGELSKTGGENPLDYETFKNNPAEFYVVAENAETGEAVYFSKDDISKDDYRVLMASSTLPGINKPYVIDGTPYFDGALADPIPIEKAIADGCDKVVVILTRPSSYERKLGKDPVFARMILRDYPASAKRMMQRAKRYNASLYLAKYYERQGKALIVAPESIHGMKTLTKDIEAIHSMYDAGYSDAVQSASGLDYS